MKILIAGASGNIGTLLSRHLLARDHDLHLMVHRRRLASDVYEHPLSTVVKADLSRPDSLSGACDGIHCVVFLAGVLFRPRPGRYLHETNVVYLKNFLNEAKLAAVPKFIMASFPHVEGQSSPDRPASGRLDSIIDAIPSSEHARTRLEAERLLMHTCAAGLTAPLIFRAGYVYGPRLKLIHWTRRLMRARLMAIWREPTWIQLIALPDFLAAVSAMIEQPAARGIYHLGDDAPLTIQQTLDILARHWGRRPPLRLPAWTFKVLAEAVESSTALARTRTPLHTDLIETAMTSAVGDTSRAREELIPELKYSSLESGLEILK